MKPPGGRLAGSDGEMAQRDPTHHSFTPQELPPKESSHTFLGHFPPPCLKISFCDVSICKSVLLFNSSKTSKQSNNTGQKKSVSLLKRESKKGYVVNWERRGSLFQQWHPVSKVLLQTLGASTRGWDVAASKQGAMNLALLAGGSSWQLEVRGKGEAAPSFLAPPLTPHFFPSSRVKLRARLLLAVGTVLFLVPGPRSRECSRSAVGASAPGLSRWKRLRAACLRAPCTPREQRTRTGKRRGGEEEKEEELSRRRGKRKRRRRKEGGEQRRQQRQRRGAEPGPEPEPEREEEAAAAERSGRRCRVIFRSFLRQFKWKRFHFLAWRWCTVQVSQAYSNEVSTMALQSFSLLASLKPLLSHTLFWNFPNNELTLAMCVSTLESILPRKWL
ncbi:uncharacterized protein LOC127547125 [Antechinus flavipes]|uniref:uncharacterized protein LOC127547125 n=1 Tax=Antechinus flavipes TaxID=38775 RepID=UPI0022360B56|nr:uncharacterized protein LOC127547125 [Antechinus flavipes]